MVRAKRGDVTAFELLVSKYRAPLIHHVSRIVPDPGVAEELTQEALLRVHRNRKFYEPRAKFSAWLYRIATNLARNWLRDHQLEILQTRRALEVADKPYFEFADPAMLIEEWLLFQLRVAEVRRAVRDLPQRQREVLELHKFEGVGCQQIARNLGMSHQAVRSLLFRAYITLRAELAHMEREYSRSGHIA